MENSNEKNCVLFQPDYREFVSCDNPVSWVEIPHNAKLMTFDEAFKLQKKLMCQGLATCLFKWF